MHESVICEDKNHNSFTYFLNQTEERENFRKELAKLYAESKKEKQHTKEIEQEKKKILENQQAKKTVILFLLIHIMNISIVINLL